MKKAILFDLDGTLWDSTMEVEEVWNKTALEYGFSFSKRQIKNIMGLTKEEIIKRLFNGDEIGIEFITKCQNEENKYLRKNGGHIYKNTIVTIKELASKFDLYIISNCQSGYIESFLEYYSLKKFFKDFECSGNTGKAKPENIYSVLKRNNIKDAIYVGDTRERL